MDSYPIRRRNEPRHFDPETDAYPLTPADERQFIEFRSNNRGGDRSATVEITPPVAPTNVFTCECPSGPTVVVNAERDEVCRVCGVVFRGGSAHFEFHYQLGNDEYWDAADTGESRRLHNAVNHRHRGSSYRHHYHFSEKLSVWCNIEPRIPWLDCHLIRRLWEIYCEERGLDPFQTAGTAPKNDIQACLKPLGHLARKYSERWIQICCMLLGDRDSTAPLRERGFAFPTIGDLAKLRERFRVFTRKFLQLRNARGFPDGRHNVSYLDSLIMQLLCGIDPRKAKAFAWAFYPLRTPKHRCRSEARVAYIYKRLRDDVTVRNDAFSHRQRSAYNWDYVPLIFDNDRERFDAQLNAFISHFES